MSFNDKTGSIVPWRKEIKVHHRSGLWGATQDQMCPGLEGKGRENKGKH